MGDVYSMVVGRGLVGFPNRGLTLVIRVLLGFPYYLEGFVKISARERHAELVLRVPTLSSVTLG